MLERRLQRIIEWAELTVVLAEGQLRLHGAGVELAELAFSSGDTGTKNSSGSCPALGKAELIRKEGCTGWSLARAVQI